MHLSNEKTDFLQNIRKKLDMVKWVLFDDSTFHIYENELKKQEI